MKGQAALPAVPVRSPSQARCSSTLDHAHGHQQPAARRPQTPPLRLVGPPGRPARRLPARTVQQWAIESLASPTYTNPTLGIDQPIYNLGDVVRLKLTRDLLDAGVDRAVVTLANQELATHPQPDHFWDHRRIAHKRWWLLLPYIDEFIPDLKERGQSVVVFVDDDTVTASRQQPERSNRFEQQDRCILLYIDIPDEPAHPDLYTGPIAIYYSPWQAINDITHAIEIWRCKNRIRLQDLPPWMYVTSLLIKSLCTIGARVVDSGRVRSAVSVANAQQIGHYACVVGRRRGSARSGSRR
jgi:hypothetical protein